MQVLLQLLYLQHLPWCVNYSWIKKISPEVVESGLMSGCNKFQLLFKVLIPTARTDILIGVNQVIMQCLAMVVIASFIGAKGLGFNLKLALNQLRVVKR